MISKVIIAVAAGTVASSAPASDPIVVTDAAPKAHVSFADLQLQSSAGRKEMTRRIHLTAERMCLDSNVLENITEPDRVACYQVAVAGGLTQLRAIATR